jgi:DNA-binding response OmpR family regulator
MEVSPMTTTILTTAGYGIDLDQLESTERKRVLIIDDEVQSMLLLKSVMMRAGLDVIGATSGEEAIQKCNKVHPDIILLDLMMPMMDGWEIYQQLRRITTAPVIIISAISSKDAVVRGFQVGAEDYLTKPFHPAELVARVQRVLQRNDAVQISTSFYFPKVALQINLQAGEVTYRGKSVDLPGRALAVLSVLARHAPHVVSNDTIAQEVWGENNDKVQNRIKHLIFILRQKMEEDPASPKLILNRGRVGYRLATEESNREK